MTRGLCALAMLTLLGCTEEPSATADKPTLKAQMETEITACTRHVPEFFHMMDLVDRRVANDYYATAAKAAGADCEVARKRLVALNAPASCVEYIRSTGAMADAMSSDLAAPVASGPTATFGGRAPLDSEIAARCNKDLAAIGPTRAEGPPLSRARALATQRALTPCFEQVPDLAHLMRLAGVRLRSGEEAARAHKIAQICGAAGRRLTSMKAPPSCITVAEQFQVVAGAAEAVLAGKASPEDFPSSLTAPMDGAIRECGIALPPQS